MTIEVMKQALDCLVRKDYRPDLAIVTLRQAISQPDCRGCEHVEGFDTPFCGLERQFGRCTNGDKFQPLPKVVLYKVT